MEEDMQAERDDMYLPPRRDVHLSEEEKWTNRFQKALIFLFVLLLVSLILWGIKL